METITVTLDEAVLQRSLENMKDQTKKLNFTSYCIYAEAVRPFMGGKEFACGPIAIEVTDEKFNIIEIWRPIHSDDDAKLSEIVNTFDEATARISPTKTIEDVRALLPLTVELANIKA